MKQALHIVSFDVPYPADYGGVIDVFYKIKTLKELGIDVHLHCFLYKRPAREELLQWCKSVHYYPRKSFFRSLLKGLPFIVSSRVNSVLLERLQKDNSPILLEGVHCAALLSEKTLANRTMILRLHNAEFIYYRHLAAEETNLFKKIYFFRESYLLKRYEKMISNNSNIIALSTSDVEAYKENFNASQLQFIPAFHNHNKVVANSGKGSYCLYHGNLSVNENQEAVLWLVEEVFSRLEIPLIIAGKHPSVKLAARIKKLHGITLIADPSEEEMKTLIMGAQITLNPIRNKAGIKIKLIDSLFMGRYCISDKYNVACPHLSKLIIHAVSAEEYIEKIQSLFWEQIKAGELDRRTEVLFKYYNNIENGKAIMRLFNT